jgi:RNA:NAD 2'-phosphotransferase (TPT1/KptA family)
MRKRKLYHATDAANLGSILDKGILAHWEGVYLTDSAESAARWMGFRLAAMGREKMVVIEVEVPARGLKKGTDHSPIMEQLFGVGKSILSTKSIPAEAILNVYEYQLNAKQ